MQTLLRAGVLAAAIHGILAAQDTVHVTRANPAWGANVSLARLFTVGGPPDYIVGAAWAVAADRANRFWIYDYKEAALKRFAADGRFLGVVGRAGAGPAEYRELNGIAIVHDSIVLGWDIALGQLITFDQSGGFLATLPLGRAYTGISGALSADSSGAAYMSSRYSLDAAKKPVWFPPEKVQWMRVDESGRVTDSIVEPRYPESTEPVLRTTNGINFIPTAHAVPLPNVGVVSGLGKAFEFTVHPFHGRTRIIDVAWSPVALESEERDEWQALAEFLGSARHTTFRIPREKPAFREMRVDGDNRIWIQTYVKAIKRDLPPRDVPNPSPRIHWIEDPTFEVFEPSGRYLGKVVLPSRSTLMAARADRVWVKSTGPDGEDLVSVYRIGIPLK
jgi:hypothetical protein